MRDDPQIPDVRYPVPDVRRRGHVQLELFDGLDFFAPEDASGHAGTSAAVGDDGEARFGGICAAHGLRVFRAQPGMPAVDFLVEGWRVQVKTTRIVRPDGTVRFSTGRRGLAVRRYAGLVDFFALIYVGPDRRYLYRLLILPAEYVTRRWRRDIYLRVDDLPVAYDLSLLAPD